MNKLLQLKAFLVDRGLSLAVAESITCGNLQATIGQVSGASLFFKGGLTAYNLGQKVRHLNVEELHASKVNCVSKQVAEEMAKGVIKLFNCDIGVATTGYAEIENGEPHAFVAIASRGRDGSLQKVTSFEVKANLSRVEMQQHVTDLAIRNLLSFLDMST